EEVAEATTGAVAREHVLEIESARAAGPEARRRHLVARPVASGAQLVIGLAPGRIAQRLVGLVDRLELVFGAGLLADVGMVLAREPAIGGLDLRLTRIGLDAQNTVVILELHACSTTTARVRAVEVYRGMAAAISARWPRPPGSAGAWSPRALGSRSPARRCGRRPSRPPGRRCRATRTGGGSCHRGAARARSARSRRSTRSCVRP